MLPSSPSHIMYRIYRKLKMKKSFYTVLYQKNKSLSYIPGLGTEGTGRLCV
jgi:hypothetical protein